jgi:hypothetical protein
MSRAKTIVITFAVIGLLLFFAESALARFTPIVIQSSDWTPKDRIDVRGGRYFRRYYGDQPGCKSISRSDINGLSVRTNPTLTFVFVGNALGIACYHPVLNRMVHSGCHDRSISETWNRFISRRSAGLHVQAGRRKNRRRPLRGACLRHDAL